MDPLTAAIIGLITGVGGLVTALTVYFKAKAETEKIRQERLATSQARDSDSQTLHDAVLKLQFQATQAHDNIKLLFELNKDSTNAINMLTTQLATVLTKIDNITEILNEIKDAKHGQH